MNKDGLRSYHDELLRNNNGGATTLLLDFQYKSIGYNKALVTWHNMDGAEKNSINRILITNKDNKIIEARHVTEDKRSIIKARYLKVIKTP